MARENGRGKDFDDQYFGNKRKGEERASRGESHWADDKFLERNNNRLTNGPSDHGAGSGEGCGKAMIVILAVLGGLSWALGEAVSRVI